MRLKRNFRRSPSGLPYDRPLEAHIRALYQIHFENERRERAFLSSCSFFTTFAAVRAITHLIRASRGPFRNVSAGGKHIHHLVWGIALLLVVGYAWLLQIGVGDDDSRHWLRATAVLYGMGSALTLDEFALWLNLADDYWTKQGRESVDVVVLFGAVTSSIFWGHPFFRGFSRLLLGRRSTHG
jgi:hypothetical protein